HDAAGPARACARILQFLPRTGTPLAVIQGQEVPQMASHLGKKIQAAVLASSLLLPASGAFANDWSKSQSRTKGTVIGAVAGALLGGKKGAIVGAAVGNGVQYARHKTTRHKRHYKYVYRNGHYYRHYYE